MKKITFISTRHEEYGNCNANSLCQIISNLNPDVVFLEAFKNTYSNYHQMNYKNFGVYNNKLEIKALQKYGKISNFEYIPVLNNPMSKDFDIKNEVVCNYFEYQNLLDNYNLYINQYGFEFLNSKYSIYFHDNMRLLENEIFINSELGTKAYETINTYENEMLSNIYQYCENNNFTHAVFMCGAGHRKSIIEKVTNNPLNAKFDVQWDILEFEPILQTF